MQRVVIIVLKESESGSARAKCLIIVLFLRWLFINSCANAFFGSGSEQYPLQVPSKVYFFFPVKGSLRVTDIFHQGCCVESALEDGASPLRNAVAPLRGSGSPRAFFICRGAVVKDRRAPRAHVVNAVKSDKGKTWLVGIYVSTELWHPAVCKGLLTVVFFSLMPSPTKTQRGSFFLSQIGYNINPWPPTHSLIDGP